MYEKTFENQLHFIFEISEDMKKTLLRGDSVGEIETLKNAAQIFELPYIWFIDK